MNTVAQFIKPVQQERADFRKVSLNTHGSVIFREVSEIQTEAGHRDRTTSPTEIRCAVVRLIKE